MKNEIENSGRGHRSHWGGVCGAIFDIRPALVSSVELKTAIKPRAISYIGFSVWSNTPVLYFHSAPVFLDLAMTRVAGAKVRALRALFHHPPFPTSLPPPFSTLRSSSPGAETRLWYWLCFSSLVNARYAAKNTKNAG